MNSSILMEDDARKLVLSALERSGGDGWTTERLSHRLGLPMGTVARVMVDLARNGFVSRIDDEWYATTAFDY